MSGPRQLFFLQCGPEMPKCWTPLDHTFLDWFSSELGWCYVLKWDYCIFAEGVHNFVIISFLWNSFPGLWGNYVSYILIGFWTHYLSLRVTENVANINSSFVCFWGLPGNLIIVHKPYVDDWGTLLYMSMYVCVFLIKDETGIITVIRGLLRGLDLILFKALMPLYSAWIWRDNGASWAISYFCIRLLEFWPRVPRPGCDWHFGPHYSLLVGEELYCVL